MTISDKAAAAVRGFRQSAALLAALLAGCAAAPARAETVLIAEEAGAVFDLEGESRLIVEGVTGAVGIKVGAPGSLRFSSVTVDEPPEDLPMSLLSDGGALILRPPDGAASVPRDLWIAVPENVAVELDLVDATLKAADLREELSVTGERLDVTVARLAGRVRLELHGGTVRARALGGDAELSGSGLTAELDDVDGSIEVGVEDSSVRARRVGGSIDAHLGESRLELEEVDGDVDIDADRGTVEIVGMKSGGEFRMVGAPLQIEDAGGVVSVETDAEVRLKGIEASVQVDSFGGDVRGVDLEGILGIRASQAQVVLENAFNQTRVEGDGLDVRLQGLAQTLVVQVSGSRVSVDKASGAVVVENDYGDVSLRDVRGKVTVKSRDGNVTVLGAAGAVDIEASGDTVEVAWQSLPRDADSTIRNDGGEVRAIFSGSGGGRLVAKSRYGRIETDLGDVRVSDDRDVASGAINRIRRPTIRIECEGDLYLLSGRSGRDEVED